MAEKKKYRGGELEKIIDGSLPLSQYQATSFADPENPLLYVSQVIRLADGSYMELINQDHPSEEWLYGEFISEAEAMERIQQYKQGIGPEEADLFRPIMDEVKLRGAGGYAIDEKTNEITGDHRLLLKDSEHIISYEDKRLDVEGDVKTSVYKLTDGRFLDVISSDDYTKAKIVSEDKAFNLTLGGPGGILDGYLRSVFSEDCLDRAVISFHDDLDTIGPDYFLDRLSRLGRQDVHVVYPESLKECINEFHLHRSDIKVFDVLNSHQVDKTGEVQKEWDLYYLSKAEGFTGKFLHVKTMPYLKDQPANVLRVIEPDEALEAIRQLTAKDLIFTFRGEQISGEQAITGLLKDVEKLIDRPEDFLYKPTVRVDRWPETMDKLVSQSKAVVSIEKQGAEGPVVTSIYRMPDDSLWKGVHRSDADAAYRVSEEQAIRFVIENPIPGRVITDNGLLKHFSEFIINNYKVDTGWDHELPIEKILACKANAVKAVESMAANVSIVIPNEEVVGKEEMERFKAMLVNAKGAFTWSLEKAFSKGLPMYCSTLAASYGQFGIEATVKDMEPISYYMEGKNGVEKLFQERGKEKKLLNSVKTTEEKIGASTQHLTMAKDQQQNLGL